MCGCCCSRQFQAIAAPTLSILFFGAYLHAIKFEHSRLQRVHKFINGFFFFRLYTVTVFVRIYLSSILLFRRRLAFNHVKLIIDSSFGC